MAISKRAATRSTARRTPPMLLGAFAKYPGETGAQSVQTLETELGTHLRIDSHYYNWTDPFPGSAAHSDVAHGRIPMISWWGTNYESIIDGSQDSLIRARAVATKAFGRAMFIRWAAEMNGNWYAWSGAENGDSPAEFVQAWRHIHNIFTSVGVRNVLWVWAPNADSHPGGLNRSSWNNWANYYPGDAYVDWVGIDGYNWGGSEGWRPFGSIFAPVYNTYAGRKPIMIAETGSVEKGGNKAAWISGAARWMKRHPDVRAFVYFDTDESSSGIDWRIASSPACLAAFRSLARDPRFGRPQLKLPPLSLLRHETLP